METSSAIATLAGVLRLLLERYAEVDRIVLLVCRQAAMAARSCLQFTHFIARTKKAPPQRRYELIDTRKSEHWTENFRCLRHTDTSITFPLENSFVLVTDIVGSTRLYNDNPRRMKAQADMHDRIAKRLVRLFGGHIVANEGDSFTLAFPDVYSAVSFALNFREQLDEHSVDLAVRIGINNGLMCARNLCGYKLYGAPVEEVTAFIRHSSGAKICIRRGLLQKYGMECLQGFCIH